MFMKLLGILLEISAMVWLVAVVVLEFINGITTDHDKGIVMLCSGITIGIFMLLCFSLASLRRRYY